jgi:Icc-related predicted phosphoesterase
MEPIVAESDGRFAYALHGVRETIDTAQLDDVRKRFGFNGFYPRVVEHQEMQRMSEEPEYVKRLFEEAIGDQVVEWCGLAAERLPDSVRCIITPGNDDPRVIDAILESASKVECPERTVVQLGPVWLASLGNTNRTPWATEREFDEPELERQIVEMVDPIAECGPLVFNFHCPPYASGLDTAQELDSELKPVIDHGNPVEIPVGSTAVRDAIKRYGPVAGVHGHIHESAGARKIGRSWCFNPGSEYASGVLRGLIVDFEENGDLRSHLFTQG